MSDMTMFEKKALAILRQIEKNTRPDESANDSFDGNRMRITEASELQGVADNAIRGVI